MPENYNEENNKTGYPLHGGAKKYPESIPTSDFKMQQNTLERELDRQLAEIVKKDAEIALLKEYNTELLRLLTLSISGRPTLFTGNIKEPTYPRDACGNPVAYCTSTNTKTDVLDGLMTANTAKTH